MYRAINQIVPDAAFSLFTGDIVDHAIWNTSKPYNEQSSESLRRLGLNSDGSP